MFILGFPLLLVAFSIYNIIAFLMPGVGWGTTLIAVPMASGADWTISSSDMLIALSLVLLCGELFKTTHVRPRNMIDHGLSLMLFLGMLTEFILIKQATTSTFFLLLVIALFDVIGGFTLWLASPKNEVTDTKVNQPAPAS